MRYSAEKLIQVWNDDTGEHIDVGQDRDGLELVEIRSYNADSKIGASIAMEKEQAIMLAKAILELYDEK